MELSIIDNSELALVEKSELSDTEKFIIYILQLKMVFQRITDLSKAVSYQIEGIICNKQMNNERFTQEQMETMRICNEQIEENSAHINERVTLIDGSWNDGVCNLALINEDTQVQRVKQFVYNLVNLIHLGYDNLIYKKMVLSSLREC